MRKTITIIAIVVVSAATVFFLAKNMSKQNSPSPAPAINTGINSQNISNDSNDSSANNPPATQNEDPFQPPLDRATERVTKKPFGIFITPQTSPVQPERFQGYHTGTDFEIFPEELNTDVPVRAICSGTIALKKTASGYGGVLVQNCQLDNQSITVVYGHLKLASISKSADANLTTGETIGVLGKGYSTETDEERKHLHLAIHKGGSVNILGYVQSKSQLSDWIDGCAFVCK